MSDNEVGVCACVDAYHVDDEVDEGLLALAGHGVVGRVDAVEGVVQRGEDQANVGRHRRQDVSEGVAT
jgi:hypothetical protein